MSNQPKGCDPCSYPECGCAYSQDDPRRADAMSDDATAEEIRALNEEIERVRADAMSDDSRVEKYNRAFVEELLRAERLPPEKRFRNIEELVEWLKDRKHKGSQ